jgi:hypothetical protein
LTREGFGILDGDLRALALEALKGLTGGLDTQADEIDYEPDAVERSSWHIRRDT